MILDINGKFYEMSKDNAIEVMKFGKETMTMGIYGVYKDEYAKALVEKYDKKEDLKKAVSSYASKGFVVLYKE